MLTAEGSSQSCRGLVMIVIWRVLMRRHYVYRLHYRSNLWLALSKTIVVCVSHMVRIQTACIISNRLPLCPLTEELNGGLFCCCSRLAAFDEDCTHLATRWRDLLILEAFRADSISKLYSSGVFGLLDWTPSKMHFDSSWAGKKKWLKGVTWALTFLFYYLWTSELIWRGQNKNCSGIWIIYPTAFSEWKFVGIHLVYHYSRLHLHGWGCVNFETKPIDELIVAMWQALATCKGFVDYYISFHSAIWL